MCSNVGARRLAPRLFIWASAVALLLVISAFAGASGSAESAEAPAGAVERIVFMSTRGGTRYAIWSMAPNGSDPVQLTHPEGLDQDYEPRISPNGRKIAFVRYHSGNYDIWVMNADGSNPHSVTNNEALDQNPSWSPDSGRIAFASDRDNFFGEIYVMNADGSGVVQITDDPAYDGRPAWSPDGDRIAFESFRDSSWSNIFTVAPEGGQATNITPWEWDVAHAAWAPGETAIAVSAEGPLFMDVDSIWVIPLGGGNPARLSMNVGYFPRYSPDGSHIAFSSEENGIRQIHTIGSNGSGEVSLSTTAHSDDMPDWGYLAAGTPGDLDGSGAADESDVVVFLGYLAGPAGAPSGLANGDLDCNSKYEVLDVLVLLKTMAGIGTSC